jgi:GH24 family phage-related lysozyme (muramidase)
MQAAISNRALELIVDSEGLNQPGKWPGGLSGITIGIGYDLGYVTVDQFESDWGELLPVDARSRLAGCIGLRGIRAKNRAASVGDIRIPRAKAERVFTQKTLPATAQRTEQAFPGCDRLPSDARGALASLVYNRGTSMVDDSPEDRRREMRAIRDAVARGDLQAIADQLRAMKRLWAGRHLDGLVARREAEAKLVEACIAEARATTISASPPSSGPAAR